MTTEHIWQLSLVIFFGALCLGILIGVLLFAYGKNGLLAARAELDTEVELNVKLLKEKYEWILERANLRRTLRDPIKLAEILKLAKEVDETISAHNAELSTAGVQEGASGNPGHVDTLASSSLWNCAEQGHRMATWTISGDLTRKCLHCPHTDGSAA